MRCSAGERRAAGTWTVTSGGEPEDGEGGRLLGGGQSPAGAQGGAGSVRVPPCQRASERTRCRRENGARTARD